jgi:hypothetical protein
MPMLLVHYKLIERYNHRYNFQQFQQFGSLITTFYQSLVPSLRLHQLPNNQLHNFVKSQIDKMKITMKDLEKGLGAVEGLARIGKEAAGTKEYKKKDKPTMKPLPEAPAVAEAVVGDTFFGF